MGATDTVLAEELVEAVGSLRRQLRGSAGRPWPQADLTAAEVDLVRLVRRRPLVTVAQAATGLGLAPNTVSTLVRRLVGAGLVTRLRDPEDRRVVRLALTPAALRQVEAWRDHRTTVVSGSLAQLPTAERRRLAAAVPAMRRLTELLRDSAQEDR
jgi:DNA-binding MarR family transcriptional regulator